MLFFVKRIYADQLKTGQKTIELRAGKRFQSLAPGRTISINGHFKMMISQVVVLPTLAETIRFAAAHHVELGMPSAASVKERIAELYGPDMAPFYAFYVRRLKHDST